MRPDVERRQPVWDPPSRAVMAVLALALGLGLSWLSGDQAGGMVALPDLSVDANSAPTAVLGALPGLGPVLAGRIVESRPFRSLDDFDRRVRGIGPAKVEALRPYLRFDADPPPPPTPKP